MGKVIEPADDRRILRRKVHLPCQVVREDDFTLLGLQCLDLSPHGMRIRAVGIAPIDTKVIISFRVPGAGVHLDGYGVVRRIERGRRQRERFPTLGLSFLDLSPLEVAILQARLRGLPPPVPQRRLRMNYAGHVRELFASHATAPGHAL